MDMLEEIFQHQKELQERLDIPKRIFSDIRLWQQYVNQMALALHEEAAEMLQATRYKDPELVPFGWKKKQEYDPENFREEIADLLHFTVNLALAGGMTSQELYERYLQKNKENHGRIDAGQVYKTREEKAKA